MPGSRYPRPAAAWYAVAVLFLAYTFSAIDRQILTLLVGPVRADLVLSDFELSLLQGAAFSLLFVFVGFPVGRLADVHSRRGIIACGIAFWCLMTTACGLSRNFLQLFLARMGVGVGEATLSPAASSLIADMFPPEKRAVAFSVYHLGYPVGGGLALVIGGLILESLDGIDVLTLGWLGEFRAWQVAFILVGLPGLLLVPLMFSFRDPVRQARLHGVHGESVPLSTVWGFVRRRWQAFGAHLSAVSFLGMLAIGTAIWYPTFLIRTYGMSPSDAGYSYGLVMGLCGAAGILCGGWASAWFAARGHVDANMRVMLIAAASKTIPLIIGPLMPTAQLALACMALATFLGQVSVGVTTAALMEIVPNEMRGQMLAVMLFLVNILGLGVGASLIAAITDFVFADDAALRYSIALASAVIAPMIVVILWRGLRHYRACALEARGWAG
ncbi:MAG: MFS transporter [Gammaproteobacteria bacterium]|nr:MFS transporter [Gammaproteobacteria bacterium]MBK9467075.1 MFS transporter [Gammaproteobacteria bacterium]